jgi:hypothetical protein
MTDRIQCPVCRFAHIPRDMDTCPQCDADLTCFRLLDRLSDMPQEPAPFAPESATQNTSLIQNMPEDRDTLPLNPDIVPGRHLKLAPLALAALTLVLGVFFLFTAYRLSVDVADVKTVIRENGTRLDRIESRLSHLLSHREKEPMPNAMRQVPVAIKPVLIEPESLKKSWKTDERSNVSGIDME